SCCAVCSRRLRPPSATLFPYTTLFRSSRIIRSAAFSGDKVVGAILFERTMDGAVDGVPVPQALIAKGVVPFLKIDKGLEDEVNGDRKSTRLNSSHVKISYAVFCLKKKN